jgi:hypothetical protein
MSCISSLPLHWQTSFPSSSRPTAATSPMLSSAWSKIQFKYTHAVTGRPRARFISPSRIAAIIPNLNPLRQAVPPFFTYFSPKTKNQTRFLDYSPLPFSLFPFILSTTAAPPARKKSLLITKHFLDFKNIYGIIPPE